MHKLISPAILILCDFDAAQLPAIATANTATDALNGLVRAMT